MIRRLLVFLSIFLCISTDEVKAIEIVADGSSWDLKGKIQEGDTRKVLNLLKGRQDWEMPYQIFVNSPGGDLVEALLLSEVLRKLHVRVIVDKHGICASACFFLYIAADWRAAEGSIMRDGKGIMAGKLGLHRPYVRGISDARAFEAEQRDIMRKVSIYLENERVPRRLIDKMMSRSSADIYWVTREDLREIGLERAEREELYLERCAQLKESATVDFGYGSKMELPPNVQRGLCSMGIEKELRGDWTKKLREGKWFPSNPLIAIP